MTDKLIAAIEAGTAPWQRPWQNVAAAGLPMNGASSRTYNGVNALLLMMMTSQAEGLLGQPLVHVQASQRDGRPGQEEPAVPHPVYFFKMLDAKGRELPGDGPAPREGQGPACRGPRQIPFLTEYRVFHASQIEGIEPMAQPTRSWTPLQTVQQLVERMQPDIRYGGNRAFYAPGPGRGSFRCHPKAHSPTPKPSQARWPTNWVTGSHFRGRYLIPAPSALA